MLWKDYFYVADAVIFVLDAADVDRFEEARIVSLKIFDG
jgi:hypothetical protein